VANQYELHVFICMQIKPLFDEYGEVLEVVLIKNKITGTSQGELLSCLTWHLHAGNRGLVN
jgi:hypothetical protein